MPLGLQWGAGNAGALGTLDELMVQRRLAAQQEFQNQHVMHGDAMQEAELSARMAQAQAASARQASLDKETSQQHAYTEADTLADQIPPGQFLGQLDPAVGRLQTGGRGSLLQPQDARPAIETGPLLPGDTGAAKSQGFIKTASQNQINTNADNERQSEAERRAAQAQQSTEAHQRAMERLAAQAANKPAGEGKLVQIEGPDGVPIWVRESDAVNKRVANAPRQPTGADRNTLNYFNRMLQAERDARGVEDKVGNWDSGLSEAPLMPSMLENWLHTDAGQKYVQAQRSYTEARLRKESGAAIPQNEFDSDRRTNFRSPYDKPDTLKQKRAMRLQTMRGIGNAAGRSLQEYYGEGTTLDSLLKEFEDKPSGGPVSMVAPDGRELAVPADKVAEMEAHGAKRR